MSSFVGCVTVRLNSKRIPLKNIKKIGGKTLVSRAISTLNNVKKLNDIYLYSSSTKIKEYIEKDLNYIFLKRPKYLDDDDITFKELLLEFVKEVQAEYIVLLNCTSPFIKPYIIDDMIKKIECGEIYDSAFAVTEIKNYCWYNKKPLNFNIDNVPKTQDLQPILVETSSLYIINVDYFKQTGRRIGKKPYVKIVNYVDGWDIDTEDDLYIAKILNSVKKEDV